jgi:hypothetical protein
MKGNRKLVEEYRPAWKRYDLSLKELQNATDNGDRGQMEPLLLSAEMTRLKYRAARDRLAAEMLGADMADLAPATEHRRTRDMARNFCGSFQASPTERLKTTGCAPSASFAMRARRPNNYPVVVMVGGVSSPQCIRLWPEMGAIAAQNAKSVSLAFRRPSLNAADSRRFRTSARQEWLRLRLRSSLVFQMADACNLRASARLE